eukprot:TRINITY_DN283_c1_g1_i1.p1 TRINITY_DN283_c1_g1~~TRINITY_DN283_c1_g1_i1.p1  ORF type:complete len:146 (+),score=54.38 TRINITY_DN283_c1_g1_i1:83-520(+)
MAGFDKNDFLRRTFATADRSGTGSVGKETVRKLLLAYGYHLTEVQLEDKFKALDKNSDGSVDVNEFLRIYDNLNGYAEAEKLESIGAYFELIDADGDGYITADEFTNYFALMGDNFASIRETFNKIDVYKDGKITFFEFTKHLNN